MRRAGMASQFDAAGDRGGAARFFGELSNIYKKLAKYVGREGPLEGDLSANRFARASSPNSQLVCLL
jgi:hypothetical protein